MSQGKYTFDNMFYKVAVDQYQFARDVPAHALLHYAMTLGDTIEENKKRPSPYKKRKIYHKQLLRSICGIYGCQPEEAIKYWGEVDNLFEMLGVPKITGAENRQVGQLLNSSGQPMLRKDIN